MENRKKVLGIKKSVLQSIHKITLIAVLHSSFVAPSQNLIKAYIDFKEPLKYTGTSSQAPVMTKNDPSLLSQNNLQQTNKNILLTNNILESNYSINADISSGVIGVSESNPLDDASDNVFKFNINNPPSTQSKVFLTYELYGVQDANAVSHSINDRPATGGYIVKEQKGWSIQKEEINSQWLVTGENRILFNTPKGANFQYQVKNVKLEFSNQNSQSNTSLVINAPNVNYIKENQLYLRGFLRNYGTEVKILAEQTPLTFTQGEFEGVVTLTPQIKNQKFIVIHAYDSKGLLGQQLIMLDNIIEADKYYEIEKPFETITQLVKAKSNVKIKSEGSYILFNDSALVENKEISISKLRNVDIAPMNSGIINVTKGGYAYRFMPDGTQFKKAVKIAIEYDETLIPKGNTPKDIKTFYFNTSSKNWVAIERDSINQLDKTVVSLTTHFSDYINGIIQSPESPETAGFAPTAMNDIKAVDPSSEMTIISPPEVSQKGDANISYPIKIPAGRNGVQPQLAVSYNSEAGDGWLGQGWNIATASVSIDTKWGVPTFVSDKESEMYTLNGEQLMYPKVNGEDWMPNRHYGAGNLILTDPIPRVANRQFTPRKQGSFTKIERVGNTISNYIWKVTGTDGTINWYGGKTTVEDNAVIKNAAGNIVHWALFMTQDIHGNSVKYEYTPVSQRVMSGQTGANENLNGGIIFNIKKIQYTGYNNADYKYEVLFNSTTAIRKDVTINARLGIKQIEPYFLDNIVVKKTDETQPIRTYVLSMGYGKFNKGRLNKITELDKNNKEFYKHTFDYYNDLGETGSEIYFSDGVEQDVCNDVTPCLDSDGDTVCDTVDQCPNVPGSVSNFGCPKIKCFTTNFIINDLLQATDFHVFVDNVELTGSPFANYNSFKTAFQAQHPVSVFTSSSEGITITIEPASRDYGEIKFFIDPKKPYIVKFKTCIDRDPSKTFNEDYMVAMNKKYKFSSTPTATNSFASCSPFYNSDFVIPGIFSSFDSSASVLGSSKSEGYSAGAYVGIGIGNRRLTKMTTFGVQWSKGKDKSFGMTALIDINGDGLEDIVTKDGNSLYYKKHILTRIYDIDNNPVITHSFAPGQPIIGINNFYRAFGKNKSRNFQLTFGSGRLGGFVGLNKSSSSSETDMYFTDGNGDGLMDVVRDGVVYFNRLDSDGNPNFIPDSQGSENLVITAEAVTTEIPDVETDEDIVIPAFDVVKVWEAPIDGTIKIDNTIELTDTTKEAVATIEMNKFSQPTKRCYTAVFPVPVSRVRSYVAGIANTFSSAGDSQGGTRISYTSTWGRSSQQPTPISLDVKYYIGGNVNSSNAKKYPADIKPPLYVSNGNETGRTNFAKSYSALTSSGGIYNGIVSNDILTRHPIIISDINRDYPGTSFTSQQRYEAYQRNFGGCPSPVEDIVRFGGNITTSNPLFSLLYIKRNWTSNTNVPPYCNYGGGSIPTSYSWQAPYTDTTTPITTNIAINGTVIPNSPYKLAVNNDFVRFQNYIQNQYPGSSATLNSQTNKITVIITTEQVMSNISLTATNGGASNTYPFTEVACSSVGLRVDDGLLASQNDWITYQCSPEELEFAFKKLVAEGFGLTQPYTTDPDLPSYITVEDENIGGEYGYTINNDQSVNWFDSNENAITDSTKIEALNTILTNFINSQRDSLDPELLAEEMQNKITAQQEAQAWLEEYYRIQDEEINALQSRTISQTNCKETPSELCLLYGTQLNASNRIVTKPIDKNCNGGELAVKKGDRIYFRVHSVANGNPPVNWDPKVEYTNAGYSNIIDANGNQPFSSAYSDGFVLSSKLPIVFPGKSGTAKVTWAPFPITPTDKVTYLIIKQTFGNDSNGNPSNTPTSTLELFKQECGANQTSTISPTAALNNIMVSLETSGIDDFSQTVFYFKVISTSNVDWKNCQWKPEIEFTTTTPVSPNPDGASPEGNVTSVTTEYPVPDYDLYRLFPCGTSYVQTDIGSIVNRPNLRIQPTLSGISFSGESGKINFVVKRGTVLIGTRIFTVTNGSLSGDSSPIGLGTTGDPKLEIMYTVDDSESDINSSGLLKKLALTSNTLATISYNGANLALPKNQITLYQKNDAKFGSFYRQWGQFMYRPDKVIGAKPTGIANTNLIKEEALEVNLSQSQANQLNTDLGSLNENMTEAQLEAFENGHQSYLDSVVFLPANAERKLWNDQLVDRWIGFHSENYASEFAYRAEKLEESVIDVEEGSSNTEQGVVYTGAYAISKYSKGISNRNFSGGISVSGTTGPLSGGANGSFSKGGQNNMLTDYVDRNGDRYPDITTNKKTQYTNQTGGLYVPVTKPDSSISSSTSESIGFGASGSYSKSNDNKGDSKGGSGFQRFDGFKGNSGAGFSGSFQKGNSVAQRLWIDVNGDGLSDLLETTSTGTKVTLNFGPTTTYSSQNNWGDLPLFNSKSNGISGGLGFNKWKGSVEAGVALTTSWNSATNTLADINGDGLMDLIYPDTNFTVKLNVGNQFIDSKQWANFDLTRESGTVGASINAGVTFALVWRFWGFSFKIPAVNVSGTPLSTSTNKTKKTITDYDGDGYADLIEEIAPNKIKIYHSKIRRTDKLKSVTNPLGGVFTVDYKVQPVNYDNPTAKWVMSSVVIDDKCDKINDGKDQNKKEFVYENGRYDRREREFYGYKTVKTLDYITDAAAPYRTSVGVYNNRSYFLNGMMEESYVIKGADSNKKFFRTKNEYKLFALDNNNDKIINLSSPLPDLFDVGGSEGRRTAAVLLIKTENELYELAATAQITKEVTFKYDEKGRLIEFINTGNTAEIIDDYKSTIIYHTGMETLNIINVPKSIKVLVGTTTMRERTTEVNLATGRVIKVSAKNGSITLDTTMDYDQYGNLKRITYPKNTANQSMSYTYEYDTTHNKYVAKITDAFGYSTTTTYNSNFDKPEKTTDITGNYMDYAYDDFGRTITVLGPKERLAGKKYTIKFEYFPYLGLLPSSSGATEANFAPVAVTSHYDPQNPTNDIQTYTFIDGLGRPIQVKKDIAINTGTTASPTITEQLSISGKTTYDEFGRAIAQFHPWSETIAAGTKYLVNEYDVPHKSTVEYDELDRPVKNTDPEGTISKMEYSVGTIGGRTAIKTKSTVEQNSTQSIASETYNDVSGNTIFTQNNSTTGNLVTKFIYNAINELQSYTDASNLTTNYKYDQLGRKIEMVHPDSGKTTYTYDNVNLTSVQTANLQPTGKFIKYTYNRNRLEGIVYPATSTSAANVNNVVYQYGAVGSGNDTGRLTCQKDATGVQIMKYGNMGELITNTRTIVGPNIPTRQFVTQFTYDSWNRLQEIIYPDEEKIVYKYDLGGNLTKMTSKITGATDYDYIKRIDYDYYGQKTYMKYANGAETFYKYTAKLRRLDNLNVKTVDGANLYDNKYGYDKIGNVTSIANASSFTANRMAGSYSHSFVYDDLNRLKSASGNFTGSTVQPTGNDRSALYTLNMTYDAANSIATKKQQHTKNGNTFAPNTYDNKYDLFSGTHRVEKVTTAGSTDITNFKYDANGNTTERKNNQETVQYSWDEANRLKAVVNNTTVQHSVYDAGGDRVLKANAQRVLPFLNGGVLGSFASVVIEDYTVYPSPFMTIAPGGIYTNHYYAGSQRIVSRVADKNATIFEKNCTSCKVCQTPLEPIDLKQAQKNELITFGQKMGIANIVFTASVILDLNILELEAGNFVPTAKPIYFYHPDHLGTSTALTDVNGKAYQFFLNLPFGETMAEQLGPNYYNTPYKFNGKELDEETALYYYGARYYEPKYSNWLSVDPLGEKTPGWTPYRYCFNNPIRYIDPTGMSEGEDDEIKLPFEKYTVCNFSGGGWKNLDKKTLFNYVKTNSCPNCSDGRVNQMAGAKFENAFNDVMTKQLSEYNYKANKLGSKEAGSYKDKVRNVTPDGKFDLIRNEFYTVWKIVPVVYAGEHRYSGIQFAEVKATDGTLYSSYNQGQLVGMITAMASNPIIRAYGGEFIIATTSDTTISPGLILDAAANNITIIHLFAKFRFNSSGEMEVNFFKEGTFEDSGTPFSSTIKR